MASVLDILRSLGRLGLRLDVAAVQRSFSRTSNALHVVSGPAMPVYANIEGARGIPYNDVEPLLSRASAAADAAPADPLDINDAVKDLAHETRHFGRARLFWRNTAGGTRTSVNVTVWAKTALGWVKTSDAVVALAENTEWVMANVAYRDVYLETTLTGGAGEVTVYVGGEG